MEGQQYRAKSSLQACPQTRYNSLDCLHQMSLQVVAPRPERHSTAAQLLSSFRALPSAYGRDTNLAVHHTGAIVRGSSWPPQRIAAELVVRIT